MSVRRALILSTATVALAALVGRPAAAEPQPPLTIAGVEVTPSAPAADTLCQLRVRVTNRGEKIASQLGFRVRLNGQDLGVYGNQLFMLAVPPGETAEIRLYNFWTTESSRGMPPDGKLRVEVSLVEAQWMKVEMVDEVETWTPLGPVAGLPVAGSVTLELTK